MRTLPVKIPSCVPGRKVAVLKETMRMTTSHFRHSKPHKSQYSREKSIKEKRYEQAITISNPSHPLTSNNACTILYQLAKNQAAL